MGRPIIGSKINTGGKPISKSDPSKLTTRQLHREIDQLRELLDIESAWEEKLRAERLSFVNEKFALIELARIEQKADTKAAVDAALTAQKEAVKEQTTASERAIAKSESATTKQLEALNSTYFTALKGITDLLNDTKDRVSKVESIRVGADSQNNSKRADLTVFILIIGLISPIVTVLVVIFHK